MPNWHFDTLLSLAGIVDIGLIKDESNLVAPWRGPRVEMYPLSENLIVTVEFAQWAALPL